MQHSPAASVRAALLLLGLTCATCIASPASPPARIPALLAKDVDHVFAQFDRPDSPGCALGIYQQGLLSYGRGYGMAEVERGTPIGTATVFDLASVSKQFVAGLVALLVEEGRLSMDDDVRRWVPELADFGARITVGQLVHHTSGLPDYIAYRAVAGGNPPATFSAALESIARRPVLNFAPGTAFSYTNFEYDILREVVERAAKTPIRELGSKRLLTPLGMSSSRMIGRGDEVPVGIATGYVTDGAVTRAVPLVSSTAVMSSVEDLLRWDENFTGGHVGGADWAQRVVTPGTLADGTSTPYAFGNFVGSYRGHPVVRHDGSTKGFSTYLIRFPTQQLAVAVLCNIEGVPAVALAHRVVDLLLVAAPRQPPRAAPVPVKKQLSRLAGLYIDKVRGESYRLVATETGLKPESGSGELTAGADGMFRNASGTAEVTFTPGRGASRAMTLKSPMGGYSRTLERAASWAPGEEQLQEFTGSYENVDLEARHAITRQGKELLVQVNGGRVARLRPLTADTFEDVGGEPRLSMVRFTRGVRGKITGYSVHTARAWGIRFERR